MLQADSHAPKGTLQVSQCSLMHCRYWCYIFDCSYCMRECMLWPPGRTHDKHCVLGSKCSRWTPMLPRVRSRSDDVLGLRCRSGPYIFLCARGCSTPEEDPMTNIAFFAGGAPIWFPMLPRVCYRSGGALGCAFALGAIFSSHESMPRASTGTRDKHCYICI